MHILLQYYSGGDSDTILVEEYEHSQPVVVLKQAEDHIYIATNVEVTFNTTGFCQTLCVVMYNLLF